jgi:hypothetical protein
MKCHEVTDLLNEYWDMPKQDELRRTIDLHIADCTSCREEFDMWRESSELIQSTRYLEYAGVEAKPISSGVMDRIYKDESWRIPVAYRSYTFSYKVRRNIMAVFAMCLALFMVTFIHSFTTGAESEDFTELTGIIDTAHATGAVFTDQPAMFDGIPVASISAPTVLKMGPIQTYTDYLLAVSILGFVFILLIMNWLSRLRA